MNDYRISRQPSGPAEQQVDLDAHQESVNWGDVATFQDILAAPAQTSGLPSAQRALEPSLARLAGLADGHQAKVHKVQSGIARAARAGDPVQMFKLNKQYSELMLEHGLAMKVIGKATSAIEQLGKLQ